MADEQNNLKMVASAEHWILLLSSCESTIKSYLRFMCSKLTMVIEFEYKHGYIQGGIFFLVRASNLNEKRFRILN